MNAEGTLNRDEETRLETDVKTTMDKIDEKATTEEQQDRKSRNKEYASNAAMAMGGVAAGAVGASLVDGFAVSAENIVDPTPNPGPIVQPEVSDFDGNEIPIAGNITDDMSYSEAFAAARQQCGAGGVFPWRGNWYGTYYANEWDSLSPEYKNTFSSHNYQLPQGYYADNDAVANSGQGQSVVADEPTVETTDTDEAVDTTATADTTETTDAADSVVTTDAADAEVQILMPEIANVDGETFAYVPTQIDGQDVVFVDMDIDGQYDYAIVNNGLNAEPTIYDLSEQNIGNAEIIEMRDDEKTDYLVSNDLPDYANDAPVDEFTV